MRLWRLLLALTLLLGAVAPADAADVFSTDSSTPKKATVNGTAFFPRIFYDSGESSNFADQSVSNLNLGRFGMTHYLNYQFGAPYQKATAQLTPLAQLAMWGFATGNAFSTNTVDAMSAGNGTFAVVANTPSPTTPFRQLFPTLAGAGGVYLADEVNTSILSNVDQWRTTYHTDMPSLPALIVLLPEGPLVPSNGGVEDPNGSTGFMEHVSSAGNPYWWMRNLPAGGNDWIGEDPYPIFRNETATGNGGCDPNCGVLEQGGYPHFFVADRAAHTVAAATQNGKVPILILQLFTGLAGARFPTPTEMWQHPIMAITEGIRGLGWWQIGTNSGLRDQVGAAKTNAENALINITQFLKTNEATILSTPITGRLTNSTATGNAVNWRKAALAVSANAIRQTAFGVGGRGAYQAELNALNASTQTWSPMLDQSGDVRHRVFRVGSSLSYVVFAYNYAPTARNSVTFTFDAPVVSVTVVDEARTITPSGATWTDNFGGSSSLTQGANRNAHIYQVVLGPGTYFNGDSTDCPSTDKDILLCDGYERGTWYVTNGESNIGGLQGGAQPANAGWWGTIYFDQGLSYGNAKCGVGVSPFGSCAAYAGVHGGSTAGTAGHLFKIQAGNSKGLAACGATGVEICRVPEVYVRHYIKWDTGYNYGATIGGEKNVSVATYNNWPDPSFVNITYNCGGRGDGNNSLASPNLQVLHTSTPPTSCGQQNQGNDITMVPGHWYFVELHVKGSSGTAGVLELWVNDCGTNPASLNCGPTPILRTRYTGLNLPGDPGDGLIDSIYHETWSNAASGSGPYHDQLKVSLSGPIGFSGTSGGGGGGPTPPAAPTGFRFGAFIDGLNPDLSLVTAEAE